MLEARQLIGVGVEETSEVQVRTHGRGLCEVHPEGIRTRTRNYNNFPLAPVHLCAELLGERG